MSQRIFRLIDQLNRIKSICQILQHWRLQPDYLEVFVLQVNRAKTLESQDIKSSQAHRRYKLTPNVTVRSDSADDVSDIELPSVASMAELQVSTDSPSTELSVSTPATKEVEVEVEEPSNISSLFLPRVLPVEDDVLQSSPTMYNMAALQFDGAESKDCSTKPTVHHQANSIEDMVVTHGGSSDIVTNTTVTAVIPKRRSMWSRAKRFVR